ncbi:MAG TPA: cupin domain-containing protein [Clostridia bacterium]|nr:cupin domain-containing protein [Clostridia bacterium]
MSNIDEKLVADIVKRVLLEHISAKKGCEPEKSKAPSGIVGVKGSSVRCETFDTGKPGDRVYLKDVLTLEENRNLACGFMEMEESEFDWVLNYDEVDYVIEGTLVIKTGDSRITGNAGDVIMIPKGSSISFSAPGYVKFFYVTYPANWSEQ